MITSHRRAGLALLLVLSTASLADAAPDTVEASKRFSAGVALYNETDYRAALVEFKRAYDLAPSPVVLYNIGQTHYQLQNYAAAYLTLSQYLRESGPKAEHKTEVEQTISLLQARIGKIDVTTSVVGAEVTIDDELVGTTPLRSATLVSVGRRRVTVSAPGYAEWTRVIDVAAGDTVRQDAVLVSLTQTQVPGPQARERSSLVPALWITTGVLAAGAITMGVVAWRASGTLDDLRGSYPVTRTELDDQADKVTLYARIGDGLGIATLAVGGTALVLTLLRKDDRAEHASISVGPRGVLVGGRF